MRDELTLDQVFSDPLINAVMKADRVDADALRTTWMTGLVSRPMTVPVQPRREPGDSLDALVEDCLCAKRAAGDLSHGRIRGN